jgi:SAM-dependent methyltransferase
MNAAGHLPCRLLKGCARGFNPEAPLRTCTLPEYPDTGAVGDDRAVFHGTASWYARYRPRYPAELIERLAEAARLDGTGRLLDLGTGPGLLAVPLAPYVEEVVAVDPELGMLAELPPSIRAVQGRAEEVDASWGSFRLVTIGRAFHWMDPAVLERLPTDQVALVGEEQNEAHATVRKLAEELFGNRPTVRQPHVRYAQALAASPFDDVLTITVVEETTWTVEELIGFAYSTSFASLARVGDRREEFERRLRERVPAPLRVQTEFAALLGRRSDH